MKKGKAQYGYNWYFGQTFAYIRKHLGISQKDFADKVHMSQSIISRIENGTREIKGKELGLFASQFDLNSSGLHWIVTAALAKYKKGREESELLRDIGIAYEEYNEDD